MLTRTQECIGLTPQTLAADAAYGSGLMLGWLMGRGIEPRIPILDHEHPTNGTSRVPISPYRWRNQMENWSYKRNGAVAGRGSKDELKSLYDAGEITRQTLVRSSSSGGGWRRYGDVADLQPPGTPPRIPRAVKNLWPWFVFGTPLVGGLIDVIQSKGNEFVESNSSWLSHAPIGVNILGSGPING
jgi:GYF domain 2